MDTNKKNKSLISIIIFLLVTNLAMLVFFVFLNGPDHKDSLKERGRFSKSLGEDVGFTEEQLDQYQDLRKAQFDKMGPLINEVRNAKFGLYNLLYAEPVTDSVINNKAELIGIKQIQLDIQMFRHFERVRKICAQEQLPKFDTALKKLIIRMTSWPGKGSHNH